MGVFTINKWCWLRKYMFEINWPLHIVNVDKNPQEITLFRADLFSCNGFIKTFVLYYLLFCIREGCTDCGVHVEVRRQISVASALLLPSGSWKLQCGYQAVSKCLYFIFPIPHFFAVCCTGCLLVRICLLVWLCVCFSRNCLCAIHRTWHISYFNVCMRQKKKKRVQWVGFLAWFGSVTSRVGYRTPWYLMDWDP